jgi:hypothetical protein
VLGLVDARCVKKNDLGVRLCQNTENAVPGGLGLIAHDSYFLTYQGVYQGGFAHIGSPNHRNKA